jgi:hypothetical protein
MYTTTPGAFSNLSEEIQCEFGPTAAFLGFGAGLINQQKTTQRQGRWAQQPDIINISEQIRKQRPQAGQMVENVQPGMTPGGRVQSLDSRLAGATSYCCQGHVE